MALNIDVTTLIGFGGAFCTTIAFLPQVIKTWRTKSARDMSWAMLLIFTTGVAMWLIYGLLLTNWPLIAANVVTLALNGTILVLKFLYEFRGSDHRGRR